MRESKPLFFEQSYVPAVLSIFAPIEINAITLGPFVFSRNEMSEVTKNHETIHWQQYIETGIFGFLLLYLIFWIIGLIKYGNGELAYYRIPFEQEAYENDGNFDYCRTRKRYAWMESKI